MSKQKNDSPTPDSLAIEAALAFCHDPSAPDVSSSIDPAHALAEITRILRSSTTGAMVST